MSGHRRSDSSSSHLSPWDYSGVGIGFGLYRPRRPSYTFATQAQRQRSESYRCAVLKGASDVDDPADFIEGIIQRKNRKESYIRATRPNDPSEVELQELREHMKRVEEEANDPGNHPPPASPIILINDQGPFEFNNVYSPNNGQFQHGSNSSSNENHNGQTRCSIPNAVSDNHIQELKEAVARKRYSPKHDVPTTAQKPHDLPDDSVFTTVTVLDDNVAATPGSSDGPAFPSPLNRLRLRKNFVLLCISFILIFNAFRAIQNLQSTMNNADNLGIISMACVHGTMCLTCLWAPMLINNLTAKWTIVIGMFTYILWIAGNFYPTFYTLIPLGIQAGVGKGILWTAESSYLLKLSYDYSRVTREGFEREMFRFHGVFLACFQTTHVFGNLMSSLVLQSAKTSFQVSTAGSDDYDAVNSTTTQAYSTGPDTRSCGVLFPCNSNNAYSDITKDEPSSLLKLMSAYLALGVVAFFLTIVCLDQIGARFEPEHSGYEIVVKHVRMMVSNKTFRLLIPLLIFSGLQQAFVFSDFNQAYVACMIGEEYIGYCMIVLGLANIVSAVLVAVCANHVPREVVFGIGGILHMGLMIGLLIWIPDKKLAVFFFMAAAWGVCDAVWQTQCNTLLCITCPEETDMAFANCRLLQSLGLTLGFLSGTCLCVSFKLYILMILLVVAIMFYVLAEYKLRQIDGRVFEGTIEVN
ncbi:protein unc-93 homolog A-like [Dreissena polymorpha]|uniref:Uncharacterized protein n=1 Tax=Dreissena polymorpha TaxID=45954 RepID=A0A9D4G5P7_DREPO|nr:protein unc-93 homolog A-like [Dreissena polymorpha]KAH3810886.1 hypothetical protein DPMN_139284 [Dreissena polymorpha]